jgi:hypothetical protein
LAGAERRDCGGERDAVIVWRLVRLHREPKELKGSFEICDKARVRELASVAGDADLVCEKSRVATIAESDWL